eukprot:366104-Chlamydomonas_euryale.AAC.12
MTGGGRWKEGSKRPRGWAGEEVGIERASTRSIHTSHWVRSVADVDHARPTRRHAGLSACGGARGHEEGARRAVEMSGARWGFGRTVLSP